MIDDKKTGDKKLPKRRLMMIGDQQLSNKNIRTVPFPRPCKADDIRKLQRLLGHTSHGMTLQYYISTITELKPLIDKLISEGDKVK